MCAGQTSDPTRPSGPRPGPDHGLVALLDPALDGVFSRPVRLGLDDPWHAHLPFASWLAAALRPGLLVELGTGTGLAYAGFCEAVLAGGLPTRCFGVDQWDGADEAMLETLRPFHDGRYGAFSRLLRMDAGAALPRFADGSVELLHLDGLRRPADVAQDYADWLPKLSPQAVVLLHGASRREDEAGPWRFWAELAARHPSFEFPHGQGLGVLAPGAAPAPLEPLFRASGDAASTARLRGRFALLGGRWEAEARHERDGRERMVLAAQVEGAADLDRALRSLQAEHAAAAAGAAAARLLGRGVRLDRLRDELAHAKADRHRLGQEAQRRQAEAVDATARSADAATRLEQALRELGAARAALIEAGAAAREAALAAERSSRAADAAAQAQQEDADRNHRQLGRQVLALRAELARTGERLAERDGELARVLGSRSWRLTRVLRGLNGLVPTMVAPPPTIAPTDATPPEPDPALLAIVADPIRPVAGTVVPSSMPDPMPEPMPEPELEPPGPLALPAPAAAETPQPTVAIGSRWRRIRRVLFVAGEPGTPGAAYRTARAAAACVAAGYAAEAVEIFDVNPDNLAAADLVVLWRAGWSGHVQTLIGLAHAAGTRVAFDIDDLIVLPALAVAEIIDGIRTTFVTEAEGRSYFQAMQRTLGNCDLATTTTAALAAAIGRQHPVVHVLPNSHDAATERASRRAVRFRAERVPDGRVRLGYAGGTRTHQKDFATIAGAVARVLVACPETVLVLFRDPASGQGLVLLDEFPDLLPLAGRVEWRDMVPLAALPDELARFDVSLCPLEQGNPFCEAKSELKYFESALAGACLVATPTAPFRAAVAHGVTGYLPADAADWERTLLMLVRDPSLRTRIARDAHHDVLWRFGPRRLAELWGQLLAGLDGGAAGARASELGLRRGAYLGAPPPEVPDGEVLFSHDTLGEAQVTVGMTSYNYEAHLGEALDSVAAQTLDAIDLVVVDDGSRDGSVTLLLDWAARNRLRFNRLRILRTARNAGLGGARNLVFSEAETPWIMVLDSDNRLRPEACARLLQALEAEPLAAFAYPTIRQFGGSDALTGTDSFDPHRLASGNYIDAMAMVAKWAWAAAGGYYVRRDAMGWEDFSLWCRLVELGQFGLAVPDELADYRVHAGSMVNAITERDANKRAMVEFVETRHPWLRLRMRDSRLRS